MKRLDLNGSWILSASDGTMISQDAPVPGSIYSAMLEKNLLPAPYRQNSAEAYKSVMEHDYVYERSFVAESIKDCVLCCEGLDTLCDIYINEKHLAATDNMHRTYRFDVQEYLFEGENHIKIVIHSPIKYCKEKQANNPLKAFGGAEKGYGHLRKGHSMFGWDWAPDMPDGGIWKDIYIENASDGAVREVFVTQSHSGGKVLLRISARLEGCGGNYGVKICLDGKEYVYPAENGGFEAEIDVENPELWYPAGLGAQKLYDLSVSLTDGGCEKDSYFTKVGLRTVEVVSDDDKYGKSFYFVVNGLPVFAKGTNYVMEDNILPQMDTARTRRLVESVRDTNQNMIRVWGGSFFASDAFYDACDELGIMVWQDLLFSCTCYPGDSEFFDNVYAETADNIIRLRNHASLVLWCGNNECEVSVGCWRTFDYTKADERDYLVLAESVLKHAVQKYDPTRYYHPSSPSAGGGFENAASLNHGDSHDWSMWFDFADYDEMYNRFPRFVSELGFASYPTAETLAEYVDKDSMYPCSAGLDQFMHDKDGNSKILFYMSREFDIPHKIGDFCYVSQILQTMHCTKYIEHMRRNRNDMRCMGALYWQLNDCAAVISWSAVDYEGRWKAIMYCMKRAFAPVLVSCAPRVGDEVQIHVTNDTKDAVRKNIYWEIKDNYANVISSGEGCAEAEAFSDCIAAAVDVSAVTKENRRRVYLEYGTIEEGTKNCAGVMLFCRNKEYDYKEPRFECESEIVDGRTKITVKSDVFANFVELKADNARAVFDDNYFPLVPGREKTVWYDGVIDAAISLRSLWRKD